MFSTRNCIQIGLVVAAFVAVSSRSSAQTISCSSDDGRRHYCATETRGRVRLVQQHSDSPCREGYSWGSDRRGVWVDHGCRGDFAVEERRGGWGGWGQDRDRDRDRDWDRDRDRSGYNQGQVISCASDDGRRHYCQADTRGRVQLLKKQSDSSCQEGRSWGYDERGIWVDHGCRADFQVGR